MPRSARASLGGICYHAMNRGNGKAVIFHEEGDYRAFLERIRRASEITPIRILAYCLMPNHFHLVLWPYADGDLGVWMHRVLTAHVRRHQKVYETTGRIWQGRFKAFPIQHDLHLLTVLRYVERNPLRAGLVEHVGAWPWSSLIERLDSERRGILTEPPTPLPDPWDRWVQQPLTPAELEGLRRCSHRESPYGDPAWTRGTAERLGLLSTIGPRGRPRSFSADPPPKN